MVKTGKDVAEGVVEHGEGLATPDAVVKGVGYGVPELLPQGAQA